MTCFNCVLYLCFIFGRNRYVVYVYIVHVIVVALFVTDNLSESMLRSFEPSLVSIMAHHNNQPRTLRSPHNLQDERLFSLLGGIPPEYFDNLDFISMRRG